MVRSKIEINALEAAFECCLLVFGNSINVINGASEEDDLTQDFKWSSDAAKFINWYREEIAKTSQKNESFIPPVIKSVCPNCGETDKIEKIYHEFECHNCGEEF